LCLSFNNSTYSQQNNNPEKSLADLFEEFKPTQKLPCGQRDEAIRIAKEIIVRFADDKVNKDVIDLIKKRLPVLEEEEKQCKSENSLEVLFEDFKIANKSACGQRSKAIYIGKQILDLYSNDELNKDALEFVRNRIVKIENEDRKCTQFKRYDESYKAKNWREFLAVSKEIIVENSNSSLSLDVMLTFVSVAHKLTAYKNDDSYDDDTVSYAKRAIELIESGKSSKLRWGIYEPYNTRENTLGWLNYIVGYISYFRFKENKKAIPYFYKATKYNNEFKYDAFVYQAVAIYYFDKEAVTASSLTINDFISKASNISGSVAEGTNNLTEESAKKDELATLYRQLVNLYNLRYNLDPNENANSLADYIEKLINRKLIDPSAEVAGK
jgi:hypothetical protein